jgi:hypothetical protein
VETTTGVMGGGKAPLSATAMRPATLRDINRGQIRGWVFLGGALFAVLALLSWPDLLAVLIFVGLGAVMVGLGFGIQRTLRDTEAEEDA